jgi:hypothetical protein
MDQDLRNAVYESFAATGRPPELEDLDRISGSRHETESALARLHETHAVVLDDDGSIRMALPFSAVPTGITVRSAGVAYTPNCAWDALAIPVALGRAGTVTATWWDDGSPVAFEVSPESPPDVEGFIHFVVPALRWWDDIAFT